MSNGSDTIIMQPSKLKKTMDRQRHRSFMCGVCEGNFDGFGPFSGFYGNPWSPEQRRELYARMRRMDLNTYLYAPKDDYKHRLHWRKLYSDTEADELKSLIKASKENKVSFVYALSPGLDITYSSKDDVEAIKCKLKQVAKLGCTSFSLLFDDIDVEIGQSDRKVFGTLGKAQSFVTNQVYAYLEEPPIFLFCPTEYCTSRANPDLLHSTYLLDIGKELARDIDILWTGPKVVSSRIAIRAIKDVARVICRPPVIWDNLHANDYDQTRLYVGPYEGRPPELVQHLRGVLTNPNCEFEANFIVMHTLAQWSKNRIENYPKANRIINKASDKKSAKSEEDILRQADGCTGYQPKEALLCAIQDWIPEMYESKELHHHDRMGSPSRRDTRQSSKNKAKEALPKNSGKRKMEELDPLNEVDMNLFCDLFYLPFEHGPRAVHLLKEAHWLISHANTLEASHKVAMSEQPLEVRQWSDRALQFHDRYHDVTVLVDKFVNIPNRPLLYELYAYIGDMRSVLSMVNGLIKWNGMGRPEKEPFRSGEQEPWVYRGGLHAEFRRILPLEGDNDMFPPPRHEQKANTVFTIRPYFPDDKEAVYAVCRKTCDDGEDGSNIYPDHPDLVADESVGGLLALSREFCFVVEDDAGVVGYIVSTPDAKAYQKRWIEKWIPQMKKKYPKPPCDNGLSPAEKIMSTFHTEPQALPDILCEKYPAFLHFNILSRKITNLTIPKLLLTCAIKTLQGNGTRGVHTFCPVSHIHMLAFHVKLGFNHLTDDDAPEDMLVLGQLI